MVEPTTVEADAFAVVGLHYQGTNEQGGISDLWHSFEGVEDELTAIQTDQARYGVSYGGDPDTGEFEYVAGVRADPDATAPEGMTAVELPAATYIRFETTLRDIESTMRTIHTEWLPASEYELAMGPEYERYPADFDRSDPEATFDIFVPVVPAEG
jgi:AraC family transcriptional regulator